MRRGTSMSKNAIKRRPTLSDRVVAPIHAVAPVRRKVLPGRFHRVRVTYFDLAPQYEIVFLSKAGKDSIIMIFLLGKKDESCP